MKKHKAGGEGWVGGGGSRNRAESAPYQSPYQPATEKIRVFSRCFVIFHQ